MQAGDNILYYEHLTLFRFQNCRAHLYTFLNGMVQSAHYKNNMRAAQICFCSFHD